MTSARESLARNAAWISLWSNIVLMAGKLAAGWFGEALMERNDHIREVLIHLNPYFRET
ncbi:hypothetical protein ABEU95_11185 [Heyndrickxia faecalis]|uniref:hypothetical protein n=1 Tax=Heyndrickxia faecalis TaxID=2824910 RepID=UPI003D1C90A2